VWKGILWFYKSYLPVTEQTPEISLQEGNTPLLYASKVSERVGAHVYLKVEGLNPTGSFKDRGMVMAVSKALEEGSQGIMCASTGNTSASAAAYAAKSGLKCIVLIPHGHIALGKLSQALIHGAEVVSVDGNFDEALTLVKDITETEPITLVNSINPYRIEGQKTAAFEICDQLEGVPDYLAIPVGNAGNITAYWKGFTEYYHNGVIKSKPHMLGFQAEGAAPIVKGERVKNPETIATAIRIGNPASLDGAKRAIAESQGAIDAVSDEEIIKAYQLLAQHEGLFVEPASAASIAGIIKKSQEAPFSPEASIVCVTTGHGLKDPDRAVKSIEYQPTVVKPDKDSVLSVIGQTIN